MKNIIIFGASVAGKNFIKNNEETARYNILAVADNDKNKHGNYILGHKIIEPKRINDYNYDEVIISSMYFSDIKEQLMAELHMDEHRIIIPNKIQSRAFEDCSTRKLAEELLLVIARILDEANITYFLRGGCLLGLVREGSFIRWDEDIDMSVYIGNIEEVLKTIREKFQSLPREERENWGINIEESEGKLVKIIVYLKNKKNPKYNYFDLSIDALEFTDGMAIGDMTSVEEKHFVRNEYIKFQGQNISVPYDYREYLRLAYGNWETPQKEIMYTDSIVYNKPRRSVSKKII